MARTTCDLLNSEQAKAPLREADPVGRVGRVASYASEAGRSRPLAGPAGALGIGFAVNAFQTVRAGLLGAFAWWLRWSSSC